MSSRSAKIKNLEASIVKAKKTKKDLQTQIIQNLKTTDDGFKLETVGFKKKSIANNKLKVRKTLSGHTGKVFKISWSGDSRHLISCSQDRRLIVWNAQTSYKVNALFLKSQYFLTCSFSPSSTYVACGGLTNNISIYNVKLQSNDDDNNENIKDEEINLNFKNNNNNNNNNDNDSMSEESSMYVEPKKVCELKGHSQYVASCLFVNDEKILSCGGDQKCLFWDLKHATVINQFKGHDSDVMSVAVNPEKSLFVSGSVDHLVKVWDIKSGKCVSTFNDHNKDVNSVTFFPNGLAVGSGSDDGTCKLFDLRAARTLQTYKYDDKSNNNDFAVTSIGFSKSGRYLFTSYDDKKCCQFDTMTGKICQNLIGHDKRVSHLAVSPDGYALATSSWDSTIKIWA